MVRSWILGSLSKELVESFSNVKVLWDEREERFKVQNRTQIYKIQREISSIQRGNNNLVVYFNKLKKLWDDLNRLKPLPFCECGGCKCGIPKRLNDMDSSTKTIQFLMGLSDTFDGVKNHILMKESLPNENKAYAMLQTEESQKVVYRNFEEPFKASGMLVKTYNSGKSTNNKAPFRNKEARKKEDRFCEQQNTRTS